MNCSIRDKKMSFGKFVESVDEHFKAMKEPFKTQEMQRIYEEQTGKSVDIKRNRKKDKKL